MYANCAIEFRHREQLKKGDCTLTRQKRYTEVTDRNGPAFKELHGYEVSARLAPARVVSVGRPKDKNCGSKYAN